MNYVNEYSQLQALQSTISEQQSYMQSSCHDRHR